MSSKYCLIPKLADEFKKRVKSGDISPEKLAKMTSSERRSYFSSFLGEENAKNVNSLFERKILAKNRNDAMIKWAKEVTGITPEVRRDLVAKIERMVKDKKGNLLSPSEEKSFLADLASTKVGVDITASEAKKISELSSVSSEKKDVLMKDPTNEKARIDYGNSLLDMYDYVASLKPPMSTVDNIANVANVPRALMATLDFSAPFRQGFGMVTNANFWKNLRPMFKAAFDEKAYRNIQADIVSRPTYANMQKSGLRINGLGDKLTQREEAYMTTLLDRVPGVRGSERAYTGFLAKLRADAFDDLIKKAEAAGEDVKPGGQVSKDIANVVNNFTGSGKLGNIEQASPILNAMFFSPKKIAATFQILNPRNYLDPRISKTARVQAFKNLVGMVGVSASVLSLANMAGADTETDPRSSDFGKVKVGDTRFDVTGGNGNYAVLLARLVTNETKSTTSEAVKTLGESFGAPTRGETLVKFFRNKLSPLASLAGDWLYGTDALGNAFEADKAIVDRVTPLIIGTAIDTYKSDSSMTIPAIAADMFGISSSTYSKNVDWSKETGKEISQFRSKVAPEKFREANDAYNKAVNEKTAALLGDERYKSLSTQGKMTAISKLKDNVKQGIYRKYGFTYKQEKNAEKESIDRLVK